MYSFQAITQLIKSFCLNFGYFILSWRLNNLGTFQDLQTRFLLLPLMIFTTGSGRNTRLLIFQGTRETSAKSFRTKEFGT